jgi:hypothetical protein
VKREMQILTQSNSCTAGHLAGDLLEAWRSGDPVKVGTELERSISAPIAAHDTGEQELRDLLVAVAGRMSRCADMLQSRCLTPELELCVNLLGHMARRN